MDFFNFRSGRYGDTPEKMQDLTAQGADDLIATLSVAEAVARDAAACLLDGAAEYQIGGTAQEASATKAKPAPTHGMQA